MPVRQDAIYCRTSIGTSLRPWITRTIFKTLPSSTYEDVILLNDQATHGRQAQVFARSANQRRPRQRLQLLE